MWLCGVEAPPYESNGASSAEIDLEENSGSAGPLNPRWLGAESALDYGTPISRVSRFFFKLPSVVLNESFTRAAEMSSIAPHPLKSQVG
jgi:hypothetical protein